MKPEETARDEVELDIVEIQEQSLYVSRAEQVKVRRISLGRPPGKEAQAALQTKRIRHRADKGAAGP